MIKEVKGKRESEMLPKAFSLENYIMIKVIQVNSKTSSMRKLFCLEHTAFKESLKAGKVGEVGR